MCSSMRVDDHYSNFKSSIITLSRWSSQGRFIYHRWGLGAVGWLVVSWKEPFIFHNAINNCGVSEVSERHLLEADVGCESDAFTITGHARESAPDLP